MTARTLGRDVDTLAYKQDRYGRTIATLFAGKQDINLAMIQAGLAWHYKRYAREQPAEETRAFALAQELALVQLLALWHEGIPIAPWDWRANQRGDRTKNGGAIMLGAQAVHDRINP